MDPREPAGEERGKGKSAEPLFRARRGGGAAGNTCGTVCGKCRRGAIRLQGIPHVWCESAVGRGVSLPTFYFIKKYGGH